jgi:hypothetical protein
MQHQNSPGPSQTGTSEEASLQPTVIREQLERILYSSFFRRSKAYTAFLRHSVEQVLAGQSSSLKERTIGTEVFSRPPDYDTGVDHVVRSAAGEIRKRLAQYYQDPATAGEIRIDLSPGSYVPQFSFPRQASVAVEKPSVGYRQVSIAHNSGVQHWTIVGAVTLILLAAVTTFALSRLNRSALDLFWNSVLSSRGAVILCVGNPVRAGDSPEITGASAASEMSFLRSNRITFASATTLARLVGLLQSRGKQYQVLLRSATRFSDLQRGPSVLIGGFNNSWTLRLGATLRFGFDRQQGQPHRIIDRQNPADNGWSVDFSQPFHQIAHDYAIISRVRDPHTEQIAVTVAGIGHWGTLAAGEFITDPAQMQKLRASAPKNWENMNIQLVLSTDVIDGVSGPAKIVAAQFW